MFRQTRQTRSQIGELLMNVCMICASNGKIFWQYSTAGLAWPWSTRGITHWIKGFRSCTASRRH